MFKDKHGSNGWSVAGAAIGCSWFLSPIAHAEHRWTIINSRWLANGLIKDLTTAYLFFIDTNPVHRMFWVLYKKGKPFCPENARTVNANGSTPRFISDHCQKTVEDTQRKPSCLANRGYTPLTFWESGCKEVDMKCTRKKRSGMGRDVTNDCECVVVKNYLVVGFKHYFFYFP